MTRYLAQPPEQFKSGIALISDHQLTFRSEIRTLAQDNLKAEHNRSMNLFQSRLRISSAEDPDLYADARPHFAMVARRNGTVPGDARHSYPTYSSKVLKKGSLVVRRSFSGSLLPIAHRLSLELL
jgi:hypothetical protein